jgi:DNA-binding response OmpR family regulator
MTFPLFAVTGNNMSATSSVQSAARVLVVDDDCDQRFLLDTHLTRAGCTVSGVETAELALEVVDSFLPDIVIVDLLLPGMSGRELVEWLQDPSRRQTTVVTMSVLDVADHPAADSSLSKPFDKRAVLQMLTDFAPRSPLTSSVARR